MPSAGYDRLDQFPNGARGTAQKAPGVLLFDIRTARGADASRVAADMISDSLGLIAADISTRNLVVEMERTGDSWRSFLVIGLGGSGGKTIRYLKQSLGEWLNEIGWASGMPQGWQFLHIDTPSTQEAPILPGRPELLPPIEYMSLHRDGVARDRRRPAHPETDQLRRMVGGPGFHERPHRPRRRAVSSNRRHPRARSAGPNHSHLGKITALRTADAIGNCNDSGHRPTRKARAPEERGEPVLMIVSSLAGGTGAGLFLDVADMLHAEGERVARQLFRHPLRRRCLPESRRRSQGWGPSQLSSGPGRASQRGLCRGTCRRCRRRAGDLPQWARLLIPGGSCQHERSGVRRPDRGVPGDGPLSLHGDDRSSGTGRFRGLPAANWQNSAGTYGDSGGPMHMLMEPPYVGTLQGLGYAEVDLGVDRFKSYSERRIVRDAVDTLVNGHRLITDGLERYEGLTPDVIAQELAADRLTGFLNNVGINERGQEHQVVEAIALPLRERQVITGSLAEEVYRAAVENVGPKGRIDRVAHRRRRGGRAARPWRERALRRQDQGAGPGLDQGGHGPAAPRDRGDRLGLRVAGRQRIARIGSRRDPHRL